MEMAAARSGGAELAYFFVGSPEQSQVQPQTSRRWPFSAQASWNEAGAGGGVQSARAGAHSWGLPAASQWRVAAVTSPEQRCSQPHRRT